MKSRRGVRPTAKVHSERIALRLDEAQLSALDAWIAHQQPSPSRAEAIRTLLERALAAESSAAPNRTKGAPKAAQMASSEIDKLGDRTATNEERAYRKRKLILGPKEFRGMRRK
jgi:metal-responsive CopG/Arc/MetJ family transcriptional regulator